MKAKQLLNSYLQEFYLKKVNNTKHLKRWLEDKLKKVMPRELIVARGSGGGQKYKIFWNTFDDNGNANAPIYYYTDTKGIIPKMRANDHLPLQCWVDDNRKSLKHQWRCRNEQRTRRTS